MTLPASALPIAVRVLSLLAGLALAAAVAAASTVPEGRGALGPEILLNANSVGELAATPEGTPFLRARELRPGGQAAEGELKLTNQTPSPLAVRVRTRPSARDLDRALAVELRADGQRLYRGPLGGLRRWSAPARVRVDGRIRLAVKAWVRRSAKRWQNRAVESMLEFKAQPR